MIEQIDKNNIFAALSDGEYVYGFDPNIDNLIDLRYETVDAILEYLKKDKYVYFIVKDKKGE